MLVLNRELLRLFVQYTNSAAKEGGTKFPDCTGPGSILYQWTFLHRMAVVSDLKSAMIQKLHGCTCGGCDGEWERMYSSFYEFLSDLADPPYVYPEGC